MLGQSATILTIGYATHTLEEFIGLLKRYEVAAVADVRSQPYGRVPEFSRESLAAALKAQGLKYVFMGRELGARREERDCYVNGQACYERIAALPLFQAGLKRLAEGARSHRIAIMCAEKDPIDCHRTVLICRELRKFGFHIQHVLGDGSWEPQERTERRLIERTNMETTLFDQDMPFTERLERAYEDRGREIAYRQDHEEEEVA